MRRSAGSWRTEESSSACSSASLTVTRACGAMRTTACVSEGEVLVARSGDHLDGYVHVYAAASGESSSIFARTSSGRPA